MAVAVGVVPPSAAHTAATIARKPVWADLETARRLHCKLPGELGAGHQPLKVAKAAGKCPFDARKCGDNNCPNMSNCSK